MKTEQFDDAIKRKVESIDHRFDEKDIDKVVNFVRSHHSTGWLQSPFRSLMTFSLAALILTGIVTWKLTKMHDHEILKQTMSELTKNQAIAKNESTHSNQDIIAKNNNIADNTATSSTSEENKTPETNQSNPRQKKTGQLPFQSHKENPQGFSKNNILKNKKVQHENLTTLNGHSISQESDHNNYKGPQSNGFDKKDPENVSKNIAINQNTETKNPGSENTKTNEVSTQKDPEKNNQVAENKKPDTSGKGDTYRAPKNDKHATHPLSWHVMLGGTFDKGLGNQLGGGITGELFLNNRFSFNAGLKILSTSNSSPYTDQDFDDRCGSDFHEYYLHNQHDNDKIDNITSKATLIQVPVEFSYYFPLKNNFALSVSAGTDFDLYKYQTVNYTETMKAIPPYSGDQKVPQQIPQNGPAVLFNNLVVSAGLLKQWNHLVIQINPYWAPQLKYTDYKLESNYFGMNLKIMGSLGSGGF